MTRLPSVPVLLVALAAGLACAGGIEPPPPAPSAHVLRYDRDTTIGSQLHVPDDVREIVIGRGVTVTGSFFVPRSRASELTIRGEDRKTSVIHGTGTGAGFGSDGHDDEARQYSAIFVEAPYRVTVRDLTSRDPDKFHIGVERIGPPPVAPVTVERVDLVDTRGQATTDGILGGDGTVVRDVFIDTNDDALKIYGKGWVIEDVTIKHGTNGAPIQLGWGRDSGSAVIRGLTVVADSDRPYHMGVFSRASTRDLEVASELDVSGFRLVVPDGMLQPPLFQWSREVGTHPPPGRIDDFTLTIRGLCDTPANRKLFRDKHNWVAYNDSVIRVIAPDCEH
jgi:hypothetical protein